MSGLDVVELLGVENVLPVMSKERGDGRYDPDRTKSRHIDDRAWRT
jgi:hypothetical protein